MFPWTSVVGAVAAVIVFIVIPRRRVSAWSKRSQLSEESCFTLRGGGVWFSRWWPIGASMPLVRLEQFSWGLRVGPSFNWISWYVPTTDLRWSEILVARRTGKQIRFLCRTAPGQWVSFGPLNDTRLVSILNEKGVTVD